MSNTQLFNWIQNQRVDVPHLKSIDSSVVFDFRSLLYGFVGTTPYTLAGFYIPSAANFINAQASTIQVVTAGGIAWMPGQADGSFLTVPAGTPNEILTPTNPNVVGSFTSSATNYVSVQFLRQTDPSTNDIISIWDVDADVEFTETVPLGLVLDYQIVINTSGFGSNLPIAIVSVNASGAVTSIENAIQDMFRLGSGGADPNPYATYSLSPENPLTVTANGQPDPFQTGDFTLQSFVQWMQIVMSRILNISGGSLWYANGSSLIPGLNLSYLAWDTEFSVMTGVGSFTHSSSTAGMLTWTSDIKIRSVFGYLDFTVSAGNVTLSDTQVAYVTLVRDQVFQPGNTFTFANGSNTVTAISAVTGISAGDYVKFTNDNVGAYVQVQSVTGSNIVLTSNYSGSSSTGQAVRSQGVYPSVSVASPTAVPVSANTYWLAKRVDNSTGAIAIQSIPNSGLTRTADVSTATTVNPHGLIVGQNIVVSGVSDSTFDGNFIITSVPSTTTITYDNPGPDVGAATAGNGSIGAAPTVYLRRGLGLQQGETVPIDQFAPVVMNGGPAYEEPLVVITETPSDSNHIQGPISPGTTLTLPLNSRNGDVAGSYVVGAGNLEIFLNGLYLNLNRFGSSPADGQIIDGWSEVGSIGSSATTITIQTNLYPNDVLTFRMSSGGGSGGGGGGGSGVPNVNGITSAVTFIDGVNTTVSVVGNTIAINAPGGGGSGSVPVNGPYTSSTALTVGNYGLVLVDATSGPITMSLPSSGAAGFMFFVQKIDSSANAVTLSGAGTLINGASTFVLPSQYDEISVIGNGPANSNNWTIV